MKLQEDLMTGSRHFFRWMLKQAKSWAVGAIAHYYEIQKTLDKLIYICLKVAFF